MLEGFFHADELPLFDKYRLTTSVHSNWQVKALQDARLHAPLDVYLKMNSGMNRLAFSQSVCKRSGDNCGIWAMWAISP
jgi:alanine racemase